MVLKLSEEYINKWDWTHYSWNEANDIVSNHPDYKQILDTNLIVASRRLANFCIFNFLKNKGVK
jgi:hypothetical protein